MHAEMMNDVAVPQSKPGIPTLAWSIHPAPAAAAAGSQPTAMIPTDFNAMMIPTDKYN